MKIYVSQLALIGARRMYLSIFEIKECSPESIGG
jgi:hypothetical protein